MCIWTAYAGPGNAGEITYRMLKRSYGVWGGYYTGIVSNNQGHLCVGRTAGDFSAWDSRFSIADFPGNVAIFHARTPSADDSTWSHPFGNDKVQLSEQGCYGVFSNATQGYSEMAAELVAKGYTFLSATTRHPEEIMQVRLPDGRIVHSDEVLAFYADWLRKQGKTPFEALRGSHGRCPAEAVVVCTFDDFPQSLFVANLNQHVVLAHEQGGLALSTTCISFDDPSAGDIIELPCNTIAEIRCDGTLSMEPLAPWLTINRAVPKGFREHAIEWWKGRNATHISVYWEEFLKVFWPQKSGDAPDTRAIVAYRVLDELLVAGKLTMEYESVKGFYAPEPCSRGLFTWQD